MRRGGEFKKGEERAMEEEQKENRSWGGELRGATKVKGDRTRL